LCPLEQPKARPPSRSVEPKIGLVLSPQAAGLACPQLCRQWLTAATAGIVLLALINIASCDHRGLLSSTDRRGRYCPKHKPAAVGGLILLRLARSDVACWPFATFRGDAMIQSLPGRSRHGWS